MKSAKELMDEYCTHPSEKEHSYLFLAGHASREPEIVVLKAVNEACQKQIIQVLRERNLAQDKIADLEDELQAEAYNRSME